VDSRLRCREVCRGWRAFLTDARHWQVLDLSLSSGVARRSLALLRAASVLAQGTLRELDVSGWFNMAVGEDEEAFRNEQLLPVLRANAASLLELRAWLPVDSEGGTVTSTLGVEFLLAAAPRLHLLELDVYLEGWERTLKDSSRACYLSRSSRLCDCRRSISTLRMCSRRPMYPH